MLTYNVSITVHVWRRLVVIDLDSWATEIKRHKQCDLRIATEAFLVKVHCEILASP